MSSERGEATFIVLVSTTLILIFIVFFAIVVFLNNVNIIVHNLKNDLFLIGRNSLFSIERNLLGEDIEAFYETDFKKLIEEGMKESWHLDDTLKGKYGIVEEAEIININLLKTSDKDEITNKIIRGNTIHIEVRAKIKSIILNNIFKDKFYFNLHEDIKIEKMIS